MHVIMTLLVPSGHPPSAEVLLDVHLQTEDKKQNRNKVQREKVLDISQHQISVSIIETFIGWI